MEKLASVVRTIGGCVEATLGEKGYDVFEEFVSDPTEYKICEGLEDFVTIRCFYDRDEICLEVADGKGRIKGVVEDLFVANWDYFFNALDEIEGIDE